MTINKNIILNVDSYKVGMDQMYPPNTVGVYSYIESRGGVYDKTLFFGLQAYIKEYLTKPITQADIDDAEELFAMHGEPFNRENWQYILDEYNGYLPVVIKAVPEGTVLDTKNVLVTVENTDKKCYWLTTWLETSILRAVWYSTTVATQSWSIKQVIKDYLEKTGDPSLIDFKLHDFGSRGVSSFESAGIGSAAHLINFKGTDTITGILFAREYYNEKMAGYSIPAAEHSVITSWGRDNEADAYRNMLTKFARPGSIVAVVSDSYDIYNACENIWGDSLKETIIESGATLVIRPDSGDPEEVCCKVVEILDKKFGHTVNAKGYKVLNNVRIIQGDGVCERTIRNILGHFAVLGYSADNISFGMGGQLLQKVDRDSQKFAMKCSSIGQEYWDQNEHAWKTKWIPVQKDPVTDSGKKSKAGRVTLYRDITGEYYSGVEDWQQPALVEVFRDGKLVTEYSFGQIRQTSKSS
jgi:nicotinamide phosphoribosyltransferase